MYEDQLIGYEVKGFLSHGTDHSLEFSTPYYDFRQEYLRSRQELTPQILIKNIGGLRWINVRPEWLKPVNEKVYRKVLCSYEE